MNARLLTRRCSRPAAGDAHGLAAQLRAAGLLSGRLVRRACDAGVRKFIAAIVVVAVCVVACDHTPEAPAAVASNSDTEQIPCWLHGSECVLIGFSCRPEKPGGELKCHMLFTHDTEQWRQSHRMASASK